MGNNVSYDVVGIDNVKIKMSNNVVRKVYNAKHVPELKRNLISCD